MARRNIARMAEQFIVGATPGRGGRRAAPAVARGQRLHRRPARREDRRRGRGRPLRRPGSSSCSTALRRGRAGWAPDDHLERDDLGPLPRVNVSIKPTALATHYEPLSRARWGSAGAKERLRPILRLARERGAFVHVDMEHYDVKDLTLALFRELLDEDEFADVDAGIVIQAYLRDSRDDLADLIAWSARRRRRRSPCAW